MPPIIMRLLPTSRSLQASVLLDLKAGHLSNSAAESQNTINNLTPVAGHRQQDGDRRSQPQHCIYSGHTKSELFSTPADVWHAHNSLVGHTPTPNPWQIGLAVL